MRWDVRDYVFGGLLALVCALGLFLLVCGVQSFRAAPAEATCRAKGLDAVTPNPLSAERWCVPAAGHSVDTVYVRVQP